jgi:hypothetical protein
MRTFSVALLLASTTACGTYSLVRPADTLPAGRVELAAGLAASQLGEANTILHGAVGITDDVEAYIHNEFLNTFGEVRYGILHSDTDDLGLAVGLGFGRAITLVSAIGDELDSDNADGGAAAVASATIGKRWDSIELAVGNRTFVQTGNAFLMSSTRAQARFGVSRSFGLLIEAGGTVHAPTDALDASLFIGEGSLGLWVGF